MPTDLSSGGMQIKLPETYNNRIDSITTRAWDVMYSVLKSSPIGTTNVFSSWNDELVRTKGFPMVVISPPSINIKTLDLKSDIIRADVIYMIEIFHKTSADCKFLTDKIIQAIMAGYKDFAIAKFVRNRSDWIATVSYDSWQYGDKHRLHKYTIEANYKYSG